MAYDPEMKELVRLGKRRERLLKDVADNKTEIETEVRRALAAGISQEKIAGKVGLSRLTIAKMKPATPADQQ